MISDFGFKLIDFFLQHLVLLQLASQVSNRDLRLTLDTFGGEQIDVGRLILAILKVVGFNPAFLDQGFQALVDLAEAYAEFLRQFTLGNLGVFLKTTENF